MDHRNHGVSRVLKRVLSAGVFLALVSQAQASAVAPHRAVYDLQLLRTTQGANVGSVSGRMAYEVSGSECDGWTVSFRLVNRFDYKEGTPASFRYPVLILGNRRRQGNELQRKGICR